MIIKGKNGEYKIVIGLETHAELSTNTKLFSQSKNEFASPANQNVCLFDIATPGKLPVLNRGVLNKAIAFGIAIDATINKVSRFDRKHYFYPDLPQGYQITQFFHPIISNGKLKIKYIDEKEKKEKEKIIRINRAHIEQDAGKLIHDRDADHSYIDYNRSGVPLIEIVTEPDFEDPEEVVAYLKSLQAILRATNTSVADLEKGTFRCDANVSVMPVDAKEFGTRCEIKNLNSFRFVAQAIEYEARRQVELIEKGEKVSQQTRLFNSKTGKTELMRDKADAVDYRYFPDPDLLPVFLTDKDIEDVRKNMPELPEQKAIRYSNLGLSQKESDFLVQNANYSTFFDKLIEKHDVKMASTWMLTELFGRLGKLQQTLEQCFITAEKLIGLMDNIKSGAISGKVAKDVLDEMLASDKTSDEIIKEKGLKQIDDETVISGAIDEIIDANAKQVEAYKSGNERLFGFFVGQVLKKLGNANPAIVNKLLKEKFASLADVAVGGRKKVDE